jgi:DNA-formamidopyrimidine glycosylase
MPEGPEVKILTSYLRKILKGTNISRITFIRGRYVKHDPPKNYKKFKFNCVVSDVRCRGKFIYIIFNNKTSIWITLGMTGFFSREKTRFSNAKFIYDKGQVVYFNDARNFGTITFCLNNIDLSKKLGSLGPDIFTREFNLVRFKEILRNTKNQNLEIALQLTQQNKIAGIGNYMRSEILYGARVHPLTKIKNLPDKVVRKIFINIKKVAQLSYKSQTRKLSSNDNYTNNFIFKVYGNEVDHLGNRVISKKIKDKRTIWYVPKIQKKY